MRTVLLIATLGILLPAETRIGQNQTRFTDLKILGTPATPGFQYYLTAGPRPTNTTTDGETYDAVLYLDSADNKLKVLKRNGTLVSLEP